MDIYYIHMRKKLNTNFEIVSSILIELYNISRKVQCIGHYRINLKATLVT